MTIDERMDDFERRLAALEGLERKDFAVKMQEHNDNPLDNAHWHKVPPSPIVEAKADA